MPNAQFVKLLFLVFAISLSTPVQAISISRPRSLESNKKIAGKKATGLFQENHKSISKTAKMTLEQLQNELIRHSLRLTSSSTSDFGSTSLLDDSLLMCSESCSDSVEDLEIRMLRAYSRHGLFTSSERTCIINGLTNFCDRTKNNECVLQSSFSSAVLYFFSICIPALDPNASEQVVQSELDKVTSRASTFNTSPPKSKIVKSGRMSKSVQENDDLATRLLSPTRQFCESGYHYCCSLAGESSILPCFREFCAKFGYGYWCR